jgi:hypothetical protein
MSYTLVLASPWAVHRVCVEGVSYQTTSSVVKHVLSPHDQLGAGLAAAWYVRGSRARRFPAGFAHDVLSVSTGARRVVVGFARSQCYRM